MRRFSLLLLLAVLGASSACGQILFEGFEQWVKREGREEPANWSLGLGGGAAPQSYSGERALSVWTWYCSSPGGAVLGDVKERSAYLCDDYQYGCYGDYGVPISSKPAFLSGYYRYLPGDAMPGTSDSAVVRVLLKRYNHSRGRYDTIGLGEGSLPLSESYVPFQVAIRDRAPGQLPDSIAIVFLSRGGCNCAVAGNCYYLSVDHLTLEGVAGVSAAGGESGSALRVYPNPSRGGLRIEWGKELAGPHRLRVYSISGGLVHTAGGVTGSGIAVDGAGLPPGEYLFDLTDSDGITVARGRFMVE